MADVCLWNLRNFIRFFQRTPLDDCFFINFFSQGIKNVSNNSQSFIGFLWVNKDGMFIVLDSGFRFSAYGILIIVTIMTCNLRFNFYNKEAFNLCFTFYARRHSQCKKKFCYTKVLCSVWISNIFWRHLLNIDMFKSVQDISQHRKDHDAFRRFLSFLPDYINVIWMFFS